MSPPGMYDNKHSKDNNIVICRDCDREATRTIVHKGCNYCKGADCGNFTTADSFCHTCFEIELTSEGK